MAPKAELMVFLGITLEEKATSLCVDQIILSSLLHMPLSTSPYFQGVPRRHFKHWGRGYLETGRNMSGTLQGLEHFV